MNFPNLDLNLYKPFVTVYENRNIARAAGQLILTASAVGMRIKELERQLDIKLFIPHARGVTPTKEADELYTRIKSALAVLNSAENSIKEFNETSTGVIKVGCPANIAVALLIDFICGFIVKYHNVKLEISNRPRSELAEMLAKHDIDVVINKMPIPDTMDNFIIEELCSLPRAFYANKSFLQKYNLKTELTIQELNNIPLILPSKTRDDTQMLLNALKRGVNTFTEIDGGNELIHAIINRNVGIGYVNECCVKDGVLVKKITVKGVNFPEHHLGVAYNKGEDSKPIKTFLKELKDFCEKIDKGI